MAKIKCIHCNFEYEDLLHKNILAQEAFRICPCGNKMEKIFKKAKQNKKIK